MEGHELALAFPAEPPKESEATASIAPVVGKKFVRLDYTWAVDGEPQEGSFLFGFERKRNLVAGEDGGGVVRGSYRVAWGPDWGWRTEIESTGRDSFRLRMFNVSPDARSERAVANVAAEENVLLPTFGFTTSPSSTSRDTRAR